MCERKSFRSYRSDDDRLCGDVLIGALRKPPQQYHAHLFAIFNKCLLLLAEYLLRYVYREHLFPSLVVWICLVNAKSFNGGVAGRKVACRS
jgi:hypothetical protein